MGGVGMGGSIRGLAGRGRTRLERRMQGRELRVIGCEDMKRIASLDGLRAISILLVILGHLEGTTGYPSNAVTSFLGQFPHFGVQIFFVISGFLITSLLLKEHETAGRISLKNFYLRRTFRIFPAALVYIAFATAARFLLHHPFPLKYLLAALTYTMCYTTSGPWVLAHLWSLSVEEQFYLLWPAGLVLAFGLRKKTCWAVMVVAPLVRLVYAAHGSKLIEYAFPAVADSLAAGCLLALYQPVLKRLPGWVYTATAACVVCAATLLAAVYLPHRSPLVWGAVPLLVALAIHILVTRRDWILNNRAIVYVGTLSYALYLFQQPFITQSATTNRWSAFPLNLFLALGFALLAHYLVEQPMLRVGHRLSRKASGEQQLAMR